MSSISENEILLLESDRLTDEPDGGGKMTGKVIESGLANNLFPDISSLDRTYGRTSLRKAYAAVRTPGTPTYYGAHLIISDPPEDPTVYPTLFSTSSWTDRRAEAANRIEAYLYKGPMWPGVLYSDHIAGMRALKVVQRIGTELPPIGKTLCLVWHEGQADEREQYVRVIDVDAEVTTFEDNDSRGEYQRWVVTMGLSDSLRYDFPGHVVKREDNYEADYADKTRLRDTTVADAAKFYSISPVAEQPRTGDQSVTVDSMFTPLVPATRGETPISNMSMNPEVVQTLDAGTRTVEVPQQAHTAALDVTVENRRYNWTRTLSPIPAPGSLTVSYMAQGTWYSIKDDGEGIISGASPQHGGGTIDYTTGGLSITTGALPDAGSQILIIYASPVHFQQLAGDQDIDTTVEIEHEIGDPIKPGSLFLTWLSDGVTRAAKSSIGGEIRDVGNSDLLGFVSHITGQFTLRLTSPPDPQTKLGIDYDRQPEQTVILTQVADIDGIVTGTIGEAVEPGSVRVEWLTRSTVKKDGKTVLRKTQVGGSVSTSNSQGGGSIPPGSVARVYRPATVMPTFGKSV